MYSDNQYQQALDNTASMLSSVEDYMKTRYTIEQNKEMREREDNATQRRVDDLKKAGLSPTLAAGSAASSAQGAQPSGNAIGAWLDTKNAIEQYRQNREFTESAKIQNQILRYQRESANRANVLDNLAFQWQTGGKPLKVTSNPYTHEYELDYNGSDSGYDPETHRVWFHNSLEESPVLQYLKNGLSVSNAEAQMLGKENEWYNFNQGLNAVSTGVGMGLNAFNTFGSYGLKNKSLNQDFQQFQSELNRKQNYDNWRMSPHGESYVNNRGFRYTRSRY